MESFTRLVDYLGNLKARIIPKVVRISFAQLLRLLARGAQSQRICRRVGKAQRAHHSTLKQKWWARRFAPLPTLRSCGERQRQPQPRLDPYSPEMFLPV